MAGEVVVTTLETRDGRELKRVRLHAERSLNALDESMIASLQPALEQWSTDDRVAGVFLEGTGERAFCAGGDVVGVYGAMVGQPVGAPCPEGEAYFAAEYRLDYTIQTYPKPIVTWGDGLVLGGGTGLLAGSSHAVVTERSRLGMPELPLGLFPDVGATFFLNRLPGRLGYYLGLTGVHVHGTDIFRLGLADYVIRSDQREAVVTALQEAQWGDDGRSRHEAASRALAKVQERFDATGPAPLAAAYERIQRLTDHATPGAVMDAIRTAAASEETLDVAVQGLDRGCPVSQALFDRQYRSGWSLSLVECFRREFAMAVNAVRGPDFREGVRALLVDKDRAPQWSAPSLAQVPDATVDAYFQLPADYPVHPLADLTTTPDS